MDIIDIGVEGAEVIDTDEYEPLPEMLVSPVQIDPDQAISVTAFRLPESIDLDQEILDMLDDAAQASNKNGYDWRILVNLTTYQEIVERLIAIAENFEEQGSSASPYEERVLGTVARQLYMNHSDEIEPLAMFSCAMKHYDRMTHVEMPVTAFDCFKGIVPHTLERDGGNILLIPSFGPRGG